MARIYIDTCHVADAYTFYTHIHIYIHIYTLKNNKKQKNIHIAPIPGAQDLAGDRSCSPRTASARAAAEDESCR